jgi:hypothetical protein
MIGTNDIKGIYNPDWGAGTKLNFNLSDPVSYTSYRKYLKLIIEQYMKASPNSKVAVHTLPPMGEELGSSPNSHILKANEIIHQVVSSFLSTGRVVVIDTFGALEKYLKDNTTEEERKLAMKVDDFSSVGPEALIKYNLLGYSYDDIGKRFGLKVMVDALHLNDTGARIVADGVGAWLRGELEKKGRK